MYVDAGRDPVTGKRRRVSRTFHGNLRDAKRARTKLLAEVSEGHHTGTRATVDQLHKAWLTELERKGRSPNTIDNYAKTYRRDVSPASARSRSPR